MFKINETYKLIVNELEDTIGVVHSIVDGYGNKVAEYCILEELTDKCKIIECDYYEWSTNRSAYVGDWLQEYVLKFGDNADTLECLL